MSEAILNTTSSERALLLPAILGLLFDGMASTDFLVAFFEGER